MGRDPRVPRIQGVDTGRVAEAGALTTMRRDTRDSFYSRSSDMLVFKYTQEYSFEVNLKSKISDWNVGEISTDVYCWIYLYIDTYCHLYGCVLHVLLLTSKQKIGR